MVEWGWSIRARDERLQRRVAVKVLPPELAFSGEIRERFTREAQTAARLAHPHIVPIHDVGQGEGIVYFVMGLIEGESLAARIRRRGRVPIDDTRRIMKETADALSAAHALSVIHRDIKPDNILLEGTRGRVVVTDFGIAKALSGASGATLTSAGMAIGTPSYMSPEQAAGERDIDGRSDVYSLGVVAFQMLSGQLPFNAPTVAGILMKHITEPAALLHEMHADIPEDLSLAVARCLEKDPENRWPSADALRRSLESRNVAGYRPTGLGWKAQSRPETERSPTAARPARGTRPLTDRAPATSRSPRPLAGTRPGSPRAPLGERLGRSNLPASRSPGSVASRHEARRAARAKAKDEAALPETGEPIIIRQTRADFAKTVAVSAGCFMINAAAPGLDTPWFLFVLGGMSFGLFKRYSELWQAGYSWRDVLNRPDAPDAVTSSTPKRFKGIKAVADPKPEALGKHYARVRMVHGDRAAILGLMGKLSDADREMLPEIVPTVENLYQRAHDLGQALDAMDQSMGENGGELTRIDLRLMDLRQRPDTEERNRQIALLERQRQACAELGATSRRTRRPVRELCIVDAECAVRGPAVAREGRGRDGRTISPRPRNRRGR